jgi:hypothetical protein
MKKYLAICHPCRTCGAKSLFPCIGKRNQKRKSLHISRIRDNSKSERSSFDISIEAKYWVNDDGTRTLGDYKETWIRRAS